MPKISTETKLVFGNLSFATLAIGSHLDRLRREVPEELEEEVMDVIGEYSDFVDAMLELRSTIEDAGSL